MPAPPMHGTDDRIVPVSHRRYLANALPNALPNASLTEYAEDGHISVLGKSVGKKAARKRAAKKATRKRR
jgi:pimeloyl-ACP methyl ester carboxylesterase